MSLVSNHTFLSVRMELGWLLLREREIGRVRKEKVKKGKISKEAEKEWKRERLRERDKTGGVVERGNGNEYVREREIRGNWCCVLRDKKSVTAFKERNRIKEVRTKSLFPFPLSIPLSPFSDLYTSLSFLCSIYLSLTFLLSIPLSRCLYLFIPLALNISLLLCLSFSFLSFLLYPSPSPLFLCKTNSNVFLTKRTFIWVGTRRTSKVS